MTAMTTTRLVLLGGLAVALVMVLSVAVTAGPLPNLPRDIGLRQHDGSPAKVTFSHDSHVDGKRPACTGCHPAMFKILKTSGPTAGAAAATGPGAAINHGSMEAGRYCGACHNDRAAFGLDKCDLCHRGE
jgi:c(7)-type cytochrome triheme protein